VRPLLAALSGLGLFLSFPRAGLWPLAFVALVPLLVALEMAPRRSAFWLGALTGMVFYPLNLSWVTHLPIEERIARLRRMRVSPGWLAAR
jgi:apolipoprotein N-acyltransferase